MELCATGSQDELNVLESKTSSIISQFFSTRTLHCVWFEFDERKVWSVSKDGSKYEEESIRNQVTSLKFE